MAKLAAVGGSNDKKVILKNCLNYLKINDCISEINNTYIDNVKGIDVLIPLYNLKEYSDNYSKTSFWKFMAIL